MRFNLFDGGSTEPETTRHERFSTRVYIIFLFISLFLIFIYTSLSIEMVNETMSSPSQLQYEQLFNGDFLTVHCPL